MEKQTTQEYEKAIAYIIDRIKEGSLQLGSKLPPERRIAEELGIGRNSIREAISILHGMGLIERVQGSGNYVSKHVGESIRQSLTVMLALGTITKEEKCIPFFVESKTYFSIKKQPKQIVILAFLT